MANETVWSGTSSPPPSFVVSLLASHGNGITVAPPSRNSSDGSDDIKQEHSIPNEQCCNWVLL